MDYRGVVLSAFGNIIKLVCPTCGRHGAVVWEAGSKEGLPGRRQVRDLSAGFVAVDASAKDSPRVLCDKCRVPAEDANR